MVGAIRSRAKADAARSAIARAASVERLSIVEADLLVDNGWDNAMTDCTFVMHVAYPFYFNVPKDENELMVPAVERTKCVVEAAQRTGVNCLVLNSSIVLFSRDNGSG